MHSILQHQWGWRGAPAWIHYEDTRGFFSSGRGVSLDGCKLQAHKWRRQQDSETASRCTIQFFCPADWILRAVGRFVDFNSNSSHVLNQLRCVQTLCWKSAAFSVQRKALDASTVMRKEGNTKEKLLHSEADSKTLDGRSATKRSRCCGENALTLNRSCSLTL